MIPPDFEPKIHRFDSLGSTNEKLKELALQGTAEGTIVVAKQQTRGRGRLGRSWNSPEGGLYLSVLLYPLVTKRITDLPFLVGVAVAQALQELLPKIVEVSLKWPNDVLADRKKIAGILSEAFEDEKFFGAVVGVGINVNTASHELQAFQTNPFKATSMSQFLEGTNTDVEAVLEIFKIKLFNLIFSHPPLDKRFTDSKFNKPIF
jgi:BirA family biotin operon repressor/biotin-[acetyl-CoA-carboxylase] ligase